MWFFTPTTSGVELCWEMNRFWKQREGKEMSMVGTHFVKRHESILCCCHHRKLHQEEGVWDQFNEGWRGPSYQFLKQLKAQISSCVFCTFFFCVVFFPTHIGRKTISPSNLKFPLGSGSITKTISFIMSQYPTYTSYNNLDIGPMYVLLIIKIVFCVGTMYVLIKF